MRKSVSQETRRRISAAMKGRSRSEEIKARISATLKRRAERIRQLEADAAARANA